MIHCELVLCVGCRMCEVACSSHHTGAVSPALSRIRVAKLEEIGIDMADACISCSEKPCLVCSTEALSVGDKGQVLLEVELCSGCEICVEACPVGAVGFHDDVPLFCDLCDGAPSCVEACPSDALSYRPEYKEVSLQPFMQFEGFTGQRRAHYVGVQAEPIRSSWKDGGRIDS